MIINLHEPQITCCVCGKIDLQKWGIPVDTTGLIVSNDYDGEWGGKPACRECWEIHDKGGLINYEPRY